MSYSNQSSNWIWTSKTACLPNSMFWNLSANERLYNCLMFHDCYLETLDWHWGFAQTGREECQEWREMCPQRCCYPAAESWHHAGAGQGSQTPLMPGWLCLQSSWDPSLSLEAQCHQRVCQWGPSNILLFLLNTETQQSWYELSPEEQCCSECCCLHLAQWTRTELPSSHSSNFHHLLFEQERSWRSQQSERIYIKSHNK